MKAILACDPYGGIGVNGTLPWTRLDGDMERFVSLTRHCKVVMGHKTWISLPRSPLPNRTNIVVSAKDNLELPPGVELINNIQELTNIEDAWFIGGAGLLEQVWPMITEVHLTRASDVYTCDTYINLLYLEQNFRKMHQYLYDDNSYEIWLRK